jgi:hypothetical protein
VIEKQFRLCLRSRDVKDVKRVLQFVPYRAIRPVALTVFFSKYPPPVACFDPRDQPWEVTSSFLRLTCVSIYPLLFECSMVRACRIFSVRGFLSNRCQFTIIEFIPAGRILFPRRVACLFTTLLMLDPRRSTGHIFRMKILFTFQDVGGGDFVVPKSSRRNFRVDTVQPGDGRMDQRWRVEYRPVLPSFLGEADWQPLSFADAIPAHKILSRQVPIRDTVRSPRQ